MTLNPPFELATATLTNGQPWPLGAHVDDHGVNFAVFSAHAQAIDVCFFDPSGRHEIKRLRLPGRSGNIWHGYLPGATAGLIYGWRVWGPWQPERGHRFDGSKLLLDPYARDIVGEFIWGAQHYSPDPQQPHCLRAQDNAAAALKARVVCDQFDWQGDQPPAIPLDQTIIYECHVKGLSQNRLDLAAPLRGSYAALGQASTIAYLKKLGITAVNLLPVHYSISEQRLVDMGLSNYWGYNSIGFFCPDPRLASGHEGLSPRDEFRTMVRNLHASGLEVILDVVYNHTAEADHSGPTISFRGLDNASYYWLCPHNFYHYENFSGTGNTLDMRQLPVLRLVMDSLRYWVSEMHVDGFRFDLATILGRTGKGFSSHAHFFVAVAQDPVLSRVKMIAEPWDIGPGGYQMGQFPAGWLEWNDRFRDGMRRFWIQGTAVPPSPARSAMLGEFAMRLCGSSDIYQPRQRQPAESINYVVSHDGFTLLDLLSYNQRHNLANGENNRDGHNNELNFNCGFEGPSSDPAVQQLRARLQRALLACTLLSQGTPMLCAGAELGHSQNGNNNPYCQDNANSWIDWSKIDADLLAFTSYVISLRQRLLPFANAWYSGEAEGDQIADLSWWQADGSRLQGHAWRAPEHLLVLGCLIGKPGVCPAPLLLLINNEAQPQHFVLPAGHWQVLLDTSLPQGQANSMAASQVTIAQQSLLLLQRVAAASALLLN